MYKNLKNTMIHLIMIHLIMIGMIVCSCFVYLNLDFRSRSHLFHSPTFYFCGVVAFSRPHFELIRIIPHGNEKHVTGITVIVNFC